MNNPQKAPLPLAVPPAPPRWARRAPGAESSDLFDYALLRDWAGFVLRAPRRNKLLAALAFLVVVALGALSLVALPWTWQVQTKILAQRNPIMSTLSNPYLPRPWDWDTPTQAARETVLRRNNLLALIEQTDFARLHWERRAPAVKAFDHLVRAFSPAKSRDEYIDSLVEALEKKLKVEVAEGVVIITFEWSDKELAYRMVEAALENFLEVRHTSEISIMSDAISILESHAAEVEQQINVGMRRFSESERTRKRREPIEARHEPLALPRPILPRRDEDLQKLQAQLAIKRRTIADLEEFRQRRITELQGQLNQFQAIYTDRHPAVLSLRQNIDAISGPSPQVQALKKDAAEIEAEIVRYGGQVTPAGREPPLGMMRPTVPEPPPQTGPSDDPRLDYEMGELRMLYNKYATLRDRIDGARVELDTAQAAFKYRYSVITPPQMPRKPVKPVPLKVSIAALVGAVLFALFATAVRDLRSGIVMEGWQLERKLDLPVLTEIRR